MLSGQSLLESRLGLIEEGLLGLSQPVVMVWDRWTPSGSKGEDSN